jgi:crotonobetainyl-CoA:carnitine CoA-transferase CaiB-like acyl-CoA transferase
MADVKGPLHDIRVIDLGRHQAGPRCAQVMARLGAEVIKIERLGGEETRYHAPWVRKQSAYWVQYNSGKKSVSMDLRKEAGKEALRKLIKVSDVLLQNFRPGTIEKMGFGYEVLKELNPRIVMVNVSAYGQFGPYRDQIGYDPIGQTMAGIAMVTGEEGMPPIRAGVPIIDRTTALHAAIGTLGGPARTGDLRRGANSRCLLGRFRLQLYRDSDYRLPRRWHRAEARRLRQCAAQRPVPL